MAAVATRYQNALTYGPGRSVGFYPDQGWYGPQQPVTLPTTPVASYAPVPVAAPAPAPAMNALLAPSVAPMESGGGPDLLGVAGSVLAPLAASRLASMFGNGYLNGVGVPGEITDGFGNIVTSGMDFTNGIDFVGGYNVPNAPVDVNAAFDAAGAAYPLDDAAQAGADMMASANGSGGLGDLIGSINPVTIAAGALGSWGGSRLASDLVDGDPEQQGLVSSLGGAIGGVAGGALGGIAAGAAAGSVLPGIGTLIGAFVGALGAGALGGGSPDYPYSWDTAQIGQNGLSLGTAYGMNHMSGAPAASLAQRVSGYIQDRAAAEGLQWNPYYGNAGFRVGTYLPSYDAKAPDLTYQWAGPGAAPPGAHEYDWSGGNIADLAQHAYGDLVGRGALTANPWITWDQFGQDQAQQQATYQQALQDAQANPQWTGGSEADGLRLVTPDAPTGLYSGYVAALNAPSPASVAWDAAYGANNTGGGG